MYKIFEELLKERGIRTSDVCRATGIAPSTFTDWKMGRSVPKQDKMQIIAKFFGVTTDYLLKGEEFSDKHRMLDNRISKDMELKKAIEKYYALDKDKQRYVIGLIELFSGVET